MFNFCIGLGMMLGCEFEHCFLITVDEEKKEYIMAPFFEDLFYDADNPLDVEEINKRLSNEYLSLNNEMVKNEIEYIKESGVDVDY